MTEQNLKREVLFSYLIFYKNYRLSEVLQLLGVSLCVRLQRFMKLQWFIKLYIHQKTYEPAYLFKKPKCFGMCDKSVSKCRMSSVSRDPLCFRLDQVVSSRSIDLKCGSTAYNWTISQPPVRMLSSINCTTVPLHIFFAYTIQSLTNFPF